MLTGLLDFIKTLTEPQGLIRLLSTVFTGWWGYGLLCGIVFSETGLLLGFFLPGDSLLFTVGVVCGAGQLNIFAIIVALIAASLCGNASGYMLGRNVGVKLFDRPNSKVFRREHLEKTQAFYARHGGKILIYAQFMPIVRTYAAFVAGVAGMGYGRFFSFNVIGSVGWVFSMTMLGYSLGNVPLVRANFEKVVILIILVSLTPVFLEVLKSRRKAR
ncbi:MAG: VTT domain-containing protein [Bryobacteraceae bacterium]|nr:VTT domain-containing protein [Bryobacteraceae bacterium]